jgi:hypothetical protein
MFDMATGEELLTFGAEGATAVAFSPDGRTLAGMGDKLLLYRAPER